MMVHDELGFLWLGEEEGEREEKADGRVRNETSKARTCVHSNPTKPKRRNKPKKQP